MKKYNWKYSGVKCGVYQIKNKETEESYIGISVDILARWRAHIYESTDEKKHGYNYPLMKAFRQYGVEKFDFIILEECSSDLLSSKEQLYVKQYKPVYNQTSGGKGGNVKEPLEIQEIIQELSEDKLTFSEIGKKYNYSTDMIGRINRGICWRQGNIEYPIRKNQIYTCKKRVVQLDNNGNEIQIFESATDAARKLGIEIHNGCGHINECCKGQRISAYGYKWKYPDE